MKTILMKDGSIWVARGGYDIEDGEDSNSPIVCYWCVNYDELADFDVEWDCYTPIKADDCNIEKVLNHPLDLFREGLL